MLEAHGKYLQDHLKEKVLIFEGKLPENRYFLFKCPDERFPYDFMIKDPLNLNDSIEDFTIEELEISSRDERTDLIKHLKQSKDLSI